MIEGLFGPATLVGMLRTGLDDTSATHREIASRVANALTPAGGGAAFGEALAAHGGPRGARPVDVEENMVQLANNELRYQATAHLLQKVYADLRTAITNNG
jgi:hypothetical protein